MKAYGSYKYTLTDFGIRSSNAPLAESELSAAVILTALDDALKDASQGAINSHNCLYFRNPSTSGLLWWLELLPGVDSQAFIERCNRKIHEAYERKFFQRAPRRVLKEAYN